MCDMKALLEMALLLPRCKGGTVSEGPIFFGLPLPQAVLGMEELED